jgi:nuclease S1
MSEAAAPLVCRIDRRSTTILGVSTLTPLSSSGGSRRIKYASWSARALIGLFALQSATPAWAWGRLGHRVIARIADKRLTPEAIVAIKALLPKGESLADASTWADEHRRQLPKTAPWHYVDVPLGEPKYDSKWSADDSKKGCIVDKIAEFRATL